MKQHTFIILFLSSITFFINGFFYRGNAQNISAKSASIDFVKLYQHRINKIQRTPGLAAFWDFVKREDGIGGTGRFSAYTSKGDPRQYILEPHNISRDFWLDGPEVSMADFPLLGRGPFGQAVQFTNPDSLNNLPVLLVPRKELNDSPIDIKGPGKSVSMLVWMIYQGGDHAIAGLWHEGTDSPSKEPPVVQERGQRQYGLFAGLGAKKGAASVHVSENGLASFGDVYARHLSVTNETMDKVSNDASDQKLDSSWCAVGFVYDNEKKCVTTYLNGVATENWMDDPANNKFYKYAEKAWKQAKLAAMPGVQDGEDVGFPRDQFYNPPEDKPCSESVVSETESEKVVIRTYEFTKVRFIYHKDSAGKFDQLVSTDLVSIKANPYYFGKDIYSPKTPEEGSPFTIGRAIHSVRHATLSAYIGGVAVFNEVLSPKKIKELSLIGRSGEMPVIELKDILKE